MAEQIAGVSSIPRPVDNLFGNRERWGSRATPPDREHYPHVFLWDSAFHTIVYAHFGYPDAAANELTAVLEGQNKDTGFIPNMKFGPGRRLDPERVTFKNPEDSSDYSQPPLLAHSALATLKGYEVDDRYDQGVEFVEQTYEGLDAFYEYFNAYRKDEKTGLVGVIHPHETGRDSDPTFDFAKIRLPQPRQGAPIVRGVVDKLNTGADYISALGINMKHRLSGWDISKAKDIFWAEDVMFNSIYAQNLKYMSSLAAIVGDKRRAQEYSQRHMDAESAIMSHMWDGAERAFYGISKGKSLRTLSVSNLFPIILDTIDEDKVESILALLDDPKKFNAPYPIPSVSQDNVSYDPQATEGRLWRGPVWMNTNWYIAMGLLNQRDRFRTGNPDLASRLNARALTIARKSAELVDREGYREYYSPRNGRGMRVKNFGWSTLGDVIKDTIPNMEAYTIENGAQETVQSNEHVA